MSQLSAALGLPNDRSIRCLALGAHPDDVEIGASGTLLRLLAERPETELHWLVLSSQAARSDEARESARMLLDGREPHIDLLPGRDGRLPYLAPDDTKSRVAEHAAWNPDLVLAPCRDDAHQDHRFAAELAWQVFRGPTILEYEIPKWDGDRILPNFYVPLPAAIANRKIEHLMATFPSQRSKDWYRAEAFRATLVLRGVESRAPSGLAEAFVARKLVVPTRGEI